MYCCDNRSPRFTLKNNTAIIIPLMLEQIYFLRLKNRECINHISLSTYLKNVFLI